MTIIDSFPKVAGRCPGCHMESLFLWTGGRVTCGYLRCPAPTQVADWLTDNHDYDIALRPTDQSTPELMDDIVVNNVTMFRAEQTNTNAWWVACYFANGEQLVFDVRAKCRPTRLEWTVLDRPDGFRYESQEVEA